MKKKRGWFEIYPQDSRATNLSIAGGAARLLAVLLTIAAVFFLLALAAEGFHFTRSGGHGNVLLYLLDEADDELGMAFILACGAAVCGYTAHALRRKADMPQEKP